MATVLAVLICMGMIGCGKENKAETASARPGGAWKSNPTATVYKDNALTATALSARASMPSTQAIAAGVRTTTTLTQPTTTGSAPNSTATASHEEWKSLFDGRTLGGWKPSDFPGPGEVHVKDGQLILEVGPDPLTGAAYTHAVLRMDYEISLEAMRVDGSDFFCCLTFPYKQSCCSLIVGGWGGDLVGISSFDGQDASVNETRRQMDFDDGRWYRIRVRVTENHIEAWIGDEKAVDARPGARKVAVRSEVAATQPLGLAAYRTKAAFRNIQTRKLASP